MTEDAPVGTGHSILAHADEAIGALVEVMRNGASDVARVRAANSILDLAWGKAARKVELGQSHESWLQILSDEELTKIAQSKV